ncbi:hypothetical protein [Sulfurimonas sp.]|uniref:hypothetical protein n=1 Tax=Sulfurimonas sp. TaxID=2022749 RepID=UPI0025E0922C|nr:hypothetical protein [Sulfurimonas sp.]MCK9472571.1 hypothetical protein [Sulfurimonas sp.]MDD3506015.1 hypothetical protein [Sulfurimonas sp.]
MIDIDWDEFKFFKQYSTKKGDNFEVLLDFLKSHYLMTNIQEMYETMANDDIAQLMLNKRELNSVEALQKHLFRNFNVSP